MDASSAEVVAARAVGVFVVETLVRDRTQALVWGTGILGVVLVVVGVVVGDLGGFALGALGVVVLLVAGGMLLARRAVIAVLRRVGGGPQHDRVRPVVARHADALLALVPLDLAGALRLLRLARHPSALQQHVRDTGASVARAVPGFLGEVRAVLDE